MINLNVNLVVEVSDLIPVLVLNGRAKNNVTRWVAFYVPPIRHLIRPEIQDWLQREVELLRTAGPRRTPQLNRLHHLHHLRLN